MLLKVRELNNLKETILRCLLEKFVSVMMLPESKVKKEVF